MNFADLGLSDELLSAVTDAGYSEPTPIQAQAIPSVLMMRDMIGIAQTGTGKTASFVLPMIDILAHGRARARMPRSLILEPTRELAAQVAENFEKYGKNHKLEMALLIGGVSMGDQLKALEKGVDVLIATPGRLMDLFGRGKILLTGCDLLVIDEADRMLDMGFIPDIEEICTKLPKQRQTLLFSATMPPPIKKLADKFLSNPKQIEVERAATTNVNIEQRILEVTARGKKSALKKILRQEDLSTAIIFSNRKTTVRDLEKELRRDGFAAGQIQGDMDQSSRMQELQRFKDGEINILVASDVAARGLDVKGVSHVINYDAPWHPDDYVHRIGRTGRAGAKGKSITFVTDADKEAIENIEKLIGTKIQRIGQDALVQDALGQDKSEAVSETAEPAAAGEENPRRSRSRRRKPAMDKPREQQPRDEESRAEGSGKEGSGAKGPGEEGEREEKPRARKPRDDKPRPERTEKAEPRKSEPAEGEADWNGPVPDFLSFGLKTD